MIDPIIGYHLEIHLKPDAHLLEGVATLDFPPALASNALRLAPQAEVFRVESSGRQIPFTFRNGLLGFDRADIGSNGQLTIHYRTVFDDPLPRETVGIEDPSFGVSATIQNEGCYLSAGTAWFPRIDGLRGRHQVRVTAPEGMVAVTAGRFLGSREGDGLTVSAWENDFPLDGLALTAGRLRVASDDLDGIQLLAFLSPDNADLAPGYLLAMRRHLTYYRDRLGPYPFRKFAVVENFLPTGYGLPSWTLLGKSVVRLPFLLETSLPHEIVHSWWGNAVEVDYAQGNWSEGLTTYLADYLLRERDDPGEAREYRRKLLRDYAALVNPGSDFPLSTFIGRTSRAEQAIGYGKGAMLFHQLRREAGEPFFWCALRQMAVEGRGRTLGWRDIERIFSETTQRDLSWFFAQWVGRKGAPELSLNEVSAIATAKGWKVRGVIRQTGECYRLDIPLQLTATTGEISEQTVRLTGARTPFIFMTTGEPQLLQADPATHVFRRLQPGELPATINDLLQPHRPVVVIADGQHDLFKAAKDLLRGLHWEAAEIVTEAAVTASALNGRDVLLLGWPTRHELRPQLPEGMQVDSGSQPDWAVSGGATKSDTLFAVLARRHRDDGARAILLARNAENVAAIAAKISHYGRYSLLLFSDGRNVMKKTWEPSAATMQVILAKESQK